MRTTLDVDTNLLQEAIKATGETSASKAVNIALKEYVRRKKLQELRGMIGHLDLEDNWRELEELDLRKMREQSQ